MLINKTNALTAYGINKFAPRKSFSAEKNIQANPQDPVQNTNQATKVSKSTPTKKIPEIYNRTKIQLETKTETPKERIKEDTNLQQSTTNYTPTKNLTPTEQQKGLLLDLYI